MSAFALSFPSMFKYKTNPLICSVWTFRGLEPVVGEKQLALTTGILLWVRKAQ